MLDRSRRPGLAAAKETRTLGVCLFCPARLPDKPTPRERLICDAQPCLRAYRAAHRRDQRAGLPRLYTPRGWRIRWHCGCARSYAAETFKRHRCLFWREAWPVVVVPARRAA